MQAQMSKSLTASARFTRNRPAAPPVCRIEGDNCSSENASLAPLIAHVIYRFDVGGLENGLVNLINHLPAKRYRHAIICLTEAAAFQQRLRDPNVLVVALHKRPGKDLTSYVKLWRLLRRLRPAIVHTRNLGTIDAGVVAFLAGVPHRLHGEHGWDVTDLHGTARKYQLLRLCCAPFLTRHITVSRDLEAWLRSRVGVPARKLTQIYNGVDATRFFPADRRLALAPPGFASPDCVVIGSVGRMQEVKDPLTLVRAFLDLVKRTANGHRYLRLVMIGDGALRVKAQALIDSACASGIAWLPGSRDDVPELLRTFDIFVLPSLNEGISNTVLEAMASALPVVATRVGGNAELVDDDRTGVLVPASDPAALSRALKAYAEDPDLRRRHGRAGRLRVEQSFSLEAMIRDYVELYDSVLGRTPRAARSTEP